MDFLFDSDFNFTVRDTDFTRKAVNKIHNVVTSKDFDDMDVEKIFRFLFSEMEMVSFKDYLKRYIRDRAGLTEPYRTIPDELYQEIIMDAFEQNRAPHSFQPTTVKWKTAVKRWLDQDNVQRSTIFLFGFGLRMSDEDVSEFLIKVIKETDFDLEDPWEVICLHCFRSGLPYAKAAELAQWYRELSVSGTHKQAIPAQKLREGCSEEALRGYLYCLKQSERKDHQSNIRYLTFENLYHKCQQIVAELYQDDEVFRNSDKDWKPEDIHAADIEKILCDGIPQTKSGNLQKMSKSLLNRQFQQKRITRQRLDQLLKKELEIERFDLISLQFLISSQTEDENPELRCRFFVDDINEILEQCGMMKLYPVNAYEAFVLMCLLSEMPLLTYYDVWRISYAE